MDNTLFNTIFTNIHRLSALIVVVALLSHAWTERFRKLLAAMALISLITGAHKFAAGLKTAFPGWHMWAGIKILLALHVAAMAFLLARGAGGAAKRDRWRKGAMISSLLTAALGLYLAHFAR
jgi:hypothetical protein